MNTNLITFRKIGPRAWYIAEHRPGDETLGGHMINTVGRKSDVPANAVKWVAHVVGTFLYKAEHGVA